VSKKPTAVVMGDEREPAFFIAINWPTTANSTGMKTRMKWKRILRMGHSPVRMRRHVLGDRTRVSHAATVNVQTRKYLWAERWGDRLRLLWELGIVEM
jgi:hypothetical protein